MPNYVAGPQLCTSTSQSANPGTNAPWSNLVALTTTPGIYASAEANLNEYTQNAQGFGFGFTIPDLPTTTVNGFAFQITKYGIPTVITGVGPLPYTFPVD